MRRKTKASPDESSDTESYDELKSEFDSAGVDFPRIPVDSPTDAQEEVESLAAQIIKGGDYEAQMDAIRRAMALVNGSLLQYDCAVKRLPFLYQGLAANVVHSRSELVKTSCLFISQLARELLHKFETIGDLISPLSTHLSHSKRIFSDSCRYTILNIARSCATRRILSSILDLCGARGPAQKQVAAEAIFTLSWTWPAEAISQNWSRFTTTLAKILTSKSPECRMFARRAAKGIKAMSRQKFSELASRLDIKLRVAIDAEPDCSCDRLTLEQCGIGVHKVDKTVDKPQRAQRPATPKLPAKTRIPTYHDESQIDSFLAAEQNAKQSDDCFEEEEEPRKRAFRLPETSRARKRRLHNSPTNQELAKVPSRRISMNVSNLKLVDGKEKQFIAAVREFTDTGRMNEIGANIERLSMDLIRCCADCSNANAVAALSILHDLIPPFAQNFEANLAPLMELLFTAADHGGPRAVSHSEMILRDLPKSFCPTLLVGVAGRLRPSRSLLFFVGSLIDGQVLNLESEIVCLDVLSIAFRCYNLGDSRVRQVAAHFVEAIEGVNNTAILTFVESLNDSQFSEFEEFIRWYLPELTLRSTDLEIPKVNFEAVNQWISELEVFVKSLKVQEWKSVRSRIYQDLSNALLKVQPVDPILRFVQTTIHRIGCCDHKRLLPGVLFHEKNPEGNRIVNNILQMFMHKIETEELIQSLQFPIRSTDPIIARNALDYQALIVKSVSKLGIGKVLPQMVESLFCLLETNRSDVRKAAIQCLVELFLMFGTDLNGHSKPLADSDRKLIAVHLSRRR